MKIYTTPQGYNYIGYSNLLTVDEWKQHVDMIFGRIPYKEIAAVRARQLGGRKYKGKAYGAGFIFSNIPECVLMQEIKEKFPFLLD